MRGNGFTLNMAFTALLLSTLLGSCVDLPPSPQVESKSEAENRGILVGKVIRRPTCSVEGRKEICVELAADIRLTISRLGGEETYAIETDRHGNYRITLPSGTYRVDLAFSPGREFTKDLPATVSITGGQETHLEITLDTGIR